MKISIKTVLVIISFATIMSCKKKEITFVDPLVTNRDTTVNPADDFFMYANGGWFKKNPIPSSERSNGIFRTIQDTINNQIKSICEKSAEADAEKSRAEGRAAAFKVDSAGQTSLNEATNVLNNTQTALLARKAMLDALPAIIAAASKPMEQIDKISILDARGLHGDANGADAADKSGNLADSAVAAAMRYRVGGPLIDALMGEIGIGGNSLNGMLAGAAVSNSNGHFSGEQHLPEDAKAIKGD